MNHVSRSASHSTQTSIRNLNKQDRERTPLEFAEYLVGRMYEFFGRETVIAALWCSKVTYYRCIPGVEVWDEERDAYKYQGPWPIIAHPPCGPWGKLIAFSFEDDEHGIHAMELVHRYGGVVEQPLGSQLFIQYGKPGVLVERVQQGDYGHRATKPTLLYWYKPPSIVGWSSRPVPKGR